MGAVLWACLTDFDVLGPFDVWVDRVRFRSGDSLEVLLSRYFDALLSVFPVPVALERVGLVRGAVVVEDRVLRVMVPSCCGAVGAFGRVDKALLQNSHRFECVCSGSEGWLGGGPELVRSSSDFSGALAAFLGFQGGNFVGPKDVRAVVRRVKRKSKGAKKSGKASRRPSSFLGGNFVDAVEVADRVSGVVEGLRRRRKKS